MSEILGKAPAVVWPPILPLGVKFGVPLAEESPLGGRPPPGVLTPDGGGDVCGSKSLARAGGRPDVCCGGVVLVPVSQMGVLAWDDAIDAGGVANEPLIGMALAFLAAALSLATR